MTVHNENIKRKTTSDEFSKKLASKHERVLMCDENGNCNGCNGCCSVFTPITLEEFKILKRKFGNKHQKQFVKNQNATNGEGVDAGCFFHINGKCDIYSLRPVVCRAYHCDINLSRELTLEDLKGGAITKYFIFQLLPEPFRGFYQKIQDESDRLR